MFKNNFVVSIKQNGSILRERYDTVYLPFGSEYSIYLKNLESKKALVKIEIDGKDVLDNHSLIIDPNSVCNLEGFLKSNIAKNKFRFIEKTKEISDYRGDRIDDGIIRIEFVFEKEIISYPISYTYWDSYSNRSTPYYYNVSNNGTTNTISNNTSFVREVNENGITTKGSEINEKFQYDNIGILEENSHVITIKFKGIKNEKPVYVSDKLICKVCGKKCSSTAKFCDRCGTYLEI